MSKLSQGTIHFFKVKLEVYPKDLKSNKTVQLLRIRMQRGKKGLNSNYNYGAEEMALCF